MSIEFEQVSKTYGGAPVVNGVSLKVEAGEFFVLLGPSGSGKSTLLRIAAGLADVDQGRVLFGQRDVTHVRARQRGVGVVFQHYALFRHMTVGENVEFALRVRGVKRSERIRRRDELLRLVALSGMEGRMPGQLSGGQQQRVAVARALAHEPKVLLMDEPFGALDARTRVDLRETIREVQRRLGMTTILVTHDQEEAFALADRIGVMHAGRLLETGPADVLYRRPSTRFVATFLGAANLLLGRRVAGELRLGALPLAADEWGHIDASGDEAIAVVRPEDIALAPASQELHSPLFANGEVRGTEFSGAMQKLRINIDPASGVVSAVDRDGRTGPVVVDATRTQAESAAVPLTAGQRVSLSLRRYHLLATPICAFRLLTPGEREAAVLRQTPLLQQLLASMQAPVLTTTAPADGAEPAIDLQGLGVMSASGAREDAIRDALTSGRGRLLCVSDHAPLPTRILVSPGSGPCRRSTLALIASIMRHLAATASLVGLVPGTGGRSAVPAPSAHMRDALDIRAELRGLHGVDMIAESWNGDLSSWLQSVSAARIPTLIALGLNGTPAEVAHQVVHDFGALLQPDSNCSLLLTCSNPA